MALRYQIETVHDVVYAGDRRVPQYAEPGVVSFRRGATMKEVAGEVLMHAACYVDAAAAAGKSTKLPKELALVSRKQVFHVMPNPLLALDQYNYVVRCANDDTAAFPELTLLSKAGQDLPRNGVVFCGAATLVARCLLFGIDQVLGGTVVYIDEAHESSAYTYTLRKLARPAGAAHLVLASATLSPNGFRVPEAPSSVVSRTYPEDQLPESWVVQGSGKPWSTAGKRGNMLIFVDSRKQAADLHEKYEDAGFLVYRLEANMSETAFLEAMRASRDKNGQLCVLLADYTFRDGFTFDIVDVVDTGRVTYYAAVGGKLVKKSRNLFKGELYQSSARAGRLAGNKGSYSYPDFDYQSVVCELDGVEVDAAALLCRAFGFRPITDLGDTPFSKEVPKLPLCVALNSHQPLCLQEKVLPEEKPKQKVVAPVETEVPEIGFVRKEAVREVRDVREESFDRHSDLSDDLRRALEAQKDVLEIGQYYYIPALANVNRDNSLLIFPNGYKSVMKVIDRNPVGSRGWSEKAHALALVLIVDRMNVVTCEAKAIAGAMSTILNFGSNKDPVAFRELLGDVVANLTALRVEMGSCIAAVNQLAEDNYAVVKLPGEAMKTHEDMYSVGVISAFEALPKNGDGYAEYTAGLAAGRGKLYYVPHKEQQSPAIRAIGHNRRSSGSSSIDSGSSVSSVSSAGGFYRKKHRDEAGVIGGNSRTSYQIQDSKTPWLDKFFNYAAMT